VGVEAAASFWAQHKVSPMMLQRGAKRVDAAGELDWLFVLRLVIDARTPSQSFKKELDAAVPPIDPNAPCLAAFGADEQEFLQQAFQLCDPRDEGVFSEQGFRSAMDELGMDHQSIKWASLPLGRANLLDFEGFVTSLGAWLLAREEADRSKQSASVTFREENGVRKVFDKYAKGGGLTHDIFEVVFYELVLTNFKATSVEDIETTAKALEEAGEAMDWEEFWSWWQANTQAENEEEALKIAEMFAEVCGDADVADADSFSTLVVNMVAEFPCSVVGEDIILEHVKTVEDAGGATLDDLAEWWQRCATNRRLQDFERRQAVLERVYPTRSGGFMSGDASQQER